MKKILSAVLAAFLMQMFTGGGNQLALVGESSERDGVTVTIEQVEISVYRQTRLCEPEGLETLLSLASDRPEDVKS